MVYGREILQYKSFEIGVCGWWFGGNVVEPNSGLSISLKVLSNGDIRTILKEKY